MIFNIKKGRHYSGSFFYKILHLLNFKSRMSYYIYFDDSCLYNDETSHKYDVNKLFGFSIWYHHENSYRIGWNSLNNKINLYAYSYINGERIIQNLCVVETNQEYKCIININNSKVIFTVIDSESNINQVIQPITPKKVIGYKLWPYFGGTQIASHNMVIELTEN